MKQFEILDKGNTQNRLTITPFRVTIKIQKDISITERSRIVNFFTWISNQPEMLNCTISFRSKIIQNTPLIIQLSNDTGKILYTYSDDMKEILK